MREQPARYDDAGCTVTECFDIRALLRRAGCAPGRPLPGQRLLLSLPPPPPQPILLRDGAQHSATADSGRRVTFARRHSVSSTDRRHDDANSEETISPEGSVHDYKDVTFTSDSVEDTQLQCHVRLIPDACLEELIALGTLQRVLVAHGRQVGRLAIKSFEPFRSLHLCASIIFLTGIRGAVPFERAALAYEKVAGLNNLLADSGVPTRRDLPSLLACVSTEPDDGDAAARRLGEWQDCNRTRMAYSLEAGRALAAMDTPEMHRLLGQLARQRRVVRPVFDYMYHEYARAGYTDVHVRDGALQFQIYAWVREAMERTCDDPPLSYVMCVVLFTIAEINDRVAQTVARALPAGAALGLRPTVAAAGGDDSATMSSARQGAAATGWLAPKELLCLLDWDFAAALGYLLAHRFHEMDPSATAARARVNALALSIDLTQNQPFPPIAPLMDGPLHRFVTDH
ncbi:hypothetical protein IWQ57_003701, partial [Coemansia nantahalensis]